MKVYYADLDIDNAQPYQDIPHETLVMGTPLQPANLDTSVVSWNETHPWKNEHYVQMDIDSNVLVTESRTPGHYHIRFPKSRLRWAAYSELLDVMAAAKMVDPRWAEISINRGYSALRNSTNG